MRTRPFLAAAALAVAAVIGANGVSVASPPQPYDHLKCFKIRDSLVDRRTIYLADIFPNAPFDMQKDCRLRLPAAHLCVNVIKSNVQVGGEPIATLPVDSDEARDYLCYGLKCDRDRRELPALDQFGARTLRTRRSDFLCMPANKVPAGPTPIPTPTPLPTVVPTPAPPSCQLIPGPQANLLGDVCGGECPQGLVCLAELDARGGGPCNCVPEELQCGERVIGTGPLPADGMCGGLCPDPTAICAAEASRGPDGGLCDCIPFDVP